MRMSRLKIKMTHEKEEDKRSVKRGGLPRKGLGGNATKNTMNVNAQNNPL